MIPVDQVLVYRQRIDRLLERGLSEELGHCLWFAGDLYLLAEVERLTDAELGRLQVAK